MTPALEMVARSDKIPCDCRRTEQGCGADEVAAFGKGPAGWASDCLVGTGLPHSKTGMRWLWLLASRIGTTAAGGGVVLV